MNSRDRRLCNKIYELTEGNATITTDVGQHQMWAAQYYKFTRAKNSFLHPVDLEQWDTALVPVSVPSMDSPDRCGNQYCGRRMFPYEYERDRNGKPL